MRRYRDGRWLCVALVAVAMLAWAGRARHEVAPTPPAISRAVGLNLAGVQLGMTRLEVEKRVGRLLQTSDAPWRCLKPTPITTLIFSEGRVSRIDGRELRQGDALVTVAGNPPAAVLAVLGSPSGQTRDGARLRLYYAIEWRAVEIDYVDGRLTNVRLRGLEVPD